MDAYSTISGKLGTLLYCGKEPIATFAAGHEEEAELAAELLNDAMGTVYVTTGAEEWSDG